MPTYFDVPMRQQRSDIEQQAYKAALAQVAMEKRQKAEAEKLASLQAFRNSQLESTKALRDLQERRYNAETNRWASTDTRADKMLRLQEQAAADAKVTRALQQKQLQNKLASQGDEAAAMAKARKAWRMADAIEVMQNPDDPRSEELSAEIQEIMAKRPEWVNADPKILAGHATKLRNMAAAMGAPKAAFAQALKPTKPTAPNKPAVPTATERVAMRQQIIQASELTPTADDVKAVTEMVNAGVPFNEALGKINMPIKGTEAARDEFLRATAARAAERSMIQSDLTPDGAGAISNAVQGAFSKAMEKKATQADKDANGIDDQDEVAMAWAKENQSTNPIKAKAIMDHIKAKYPKVFPVKQADGGK